MAAEFSTGSNMLLSLVVLVAVFCPVRCSSYPTSYIKTTDCFKTKVLPYNYFGLLKLSSTFTAHYPSSKPCQITYRCNNAYSNCRIFLRGENINLCGTSHTATLHDGISTTTTFTSSSSTTSTYQSTSSDQITLEIVRTSFCKDTLTLRFNTFEPSGSCSSSQYRCRNGWCIYEDLVCDRFKNCADNSDESGCSYITYTSSSSSSSSSGGSVAGWIVGVIVIIIIASVIGRVVRRRRRLAVRTTTVSSAPTTSTNVVVVGGSQPAPVPVHYPPPPPYYAAAPKY